MIDYDEGDRGEWTYAELKSQLRARTKECIALQNKIEDYKCSVKHWKESKELWERTARTLSAKLKKAKLTTW